MLWKEKTIDTVRPDFRKLNIIALVALSAAAAAIWSGLVGMWVFGIIGLAYVITLGWGVFDIGSQFFGETKWKGKGDAIAITFDDGPDPQHTTALLNMLAEEGVKAAFFVIGKKAEQHPELLKRMIDEGHVVGNHTFSHTHRFGMMTNESIRYEMRKCSDAVRNAIGRVPRYFRPPFGVMNPKIAQTVKAEELTIIGWDLRSRDGVGTSAKQILNRVLPRLPKATLLLFHDTNPNSLEAVREVIRICRDSGRPIVSLKELTGVNPYTD